MLACADGRRTRKPGKPLCRRCEDAVISARPDQGTRPRIALVTCRPQPLIPLDPDLPWLHRALLAAGADTDVVCWDDPDIDWAAYDLAVLRSTWDYTLRTEPFLAWTERCAALTVLANPPEVVRWNADKRYLGDLAAAGVPVVPTRYLAPGTQLGGRPAGRRHGRRRTAPGDGRRSAAPAAPGVCDQAHSRGWRTAGRALPPGGPAGRRGRPAAPRADARAGDHGHGAAVPAVHRHHGRTRAAVLRRAASARHPQGRGARRGHRLRRPQGRPPRPAPLGAHPAERAAAESALKAVPGAPELLYARVDLVDGDDGQPLVMELELVEPNFFLHIHPDSMQVVVDAVLARADAVIRRR